MYLSLDLGEQVDELDVGSEEEGPCAGGAEVILGGERAAIEGLKGGRGGTQVMLVGAGGKGGGRLGSCIREEENKKAVEIKN